MIDHEYHNFLFSTGGGKVFYSCDLIIACMMYSPKRKGVLDWRGRANDRQVTGRARQGGGLGKGRSREEE